MEELKRERDLAQSQLESERKVKKVQKVLVLFVYVYDFYAHALT